LEFYTEAIQTQELSLAHSQPLLTEEREITPLGIGGLKKEFSLKDTCKLLTTD